MKHFGKCLWIFAFVSQQELNKYYRILAFEFAMLIHLYLYFSPYSDTFQAISLGLLFPHSRPFLGQLWIGHWLDWGQALTQAFIPCIPSPPHLLLLSKPVSPLQLGHQIHIKEPWSRILQSHMSASSPLLLQSFRSQLGMCLLYRPAFLEVHYL